jgi:hypothetical protein
MSTTSLAPSERHCPGGECERQNLPRTLPAWRDVPGFGCASTQER